MRQSPEGCLPHSKRGKYAFCASDKSPKICKFLLEIASVLRFLVHATPISRDTPSTTFECVGKEARATTASVNPKHRFALLSGTDCLDQAYGRLDGFAQSETKMKTSSLSLPLNLRFVKACARRFVINMLSSCF